MDNSQKVFTNFFGTEYGKGWGDREQVIGNGEKIKKEWGNEFREEQKQRRWE